MGLPTGLDGTYDHLSTTQNTRGGCGQERRVAVCLRNDQPLHSNSDWSAAESRLCRCHLLGISSCPAEAQSLQVQYTDKEHVIMSLNIFESKHDVLRCLKYVINGR